MKNTQMDTVTDIPLQKNLPKVKVILSLLLLYSVFKFETFLSHGSGHLIS